MINNYLNRSEIFSLYIPKEIDFDYRRTIYKMCWDYQYTNIKFHKDKINYLLFYPKEFEEEWHPKHQILLQCYKDLSLIFDPDGE